MGNDLILQRDYDRFLQVQSNRSEKAQDYFSSNAESNKFAKQLLDIVHLYAIKH